MNSKKILLFSALIMASIAKAGCPFGICKLPKRKRVLVAYNLINPKNKIVTGYKVTPSRISFMIHLPSRPSWLYASPLARNAIKFVRGCWDPRINGFNVRIKYAGDWINLTLRNGKFIELEDWNFKWQRHKIKSTLPHPVTNLLRRVEIKTAGYPHKNTIEISMPRY